MIGKLAKRVNFRELGILFALLILWLFLAITTRQFRQFSTYASILRQSSFAGICGVGMTLCIASKHFDQSIGAMMAFLGCSFTAILQAFSDVPPQETLGVYVKPDGVNYLGITWYGALAAFLLVELMAIACGLFNGLLVAKLRIPAFIATLGTLYIYRGGAYVVSGSKPVIINQIVTPEQYRFFDYLGTGTFLGLPFSFWVMVLCAVCGTVLLRRMKLGRDTLAIGNSIGASRISGINIDWTKVLIFTILGGFVGIGSLLNTTFLASSNPGMVTGFEFTVITTVVLGGTALSGGKGSIFNSVTAAVFLVSVTVGMNALQISPYYQKIIQGLILLFAFSLNEIRSRIENLRVRSRARRESAA